MTAAEPQAKLPLVLLSLGKIGDLVSVLPLARHFAKNGPIPFAHNAQYLGLFLGVSYVKSIPLRISPQKIENAIANLSQRFERVINLQTFGPAYRGPYDKPHNVRAFLAAGLTEADFYDLDAYPLVFDKRSLEREAFLASKKIAGGKPVILLYLSCSKSSPFNGHRGLTDALLRTFGRRVEFLDLCKIGAPRIYDLLGILDRATALVTSDGSVMHLAAACPKLPVIALLGDNPLTRAEPRFQPALRLKYSEWHRRVSEIYGTLNRILLTQRGKAV